MIEAPRLLLVTDPDRARLPLLDVAAEAVAGGVDAIYLRHLAPGDDWAAAVTQIRERVPPEVLVMLPGEPPRGFPRVGQHLRERDPLPQHRWLTDPPLTSRSVHSPGEAAVSVGMRYLVAGHVYPSASKPGREPLGLAGFARVVTAAPCPVVAIGGITPERAAGAIACGAHGIAVIGAICEASDPRAAARALREAVESALVEHAKGPGMDPASATVPMITVMVNGKPRQLPEGATVGDLLASRKLSGSMAIVERNGVILPRDTYATTALEADDQLEVVHAVGGG